MRLGTGRLTWPRSERVSDRYGLVALMRDGDSLTPTTGYEDVGAKAERALGQRGCLVATITEARDSTHIGDLFRGLFPGGAEVGDRIVLGTGELFSHITEGGMPCVGLRPPERRASDWLDPKALYRCHEQTVELDFEEG